MVILHFDTHIYQRGPGIREQPEETHIKPPSYLVIQPMAFLVWVLTTVSPLLSNWITLDYCIVHFIHKICCDTECTQISAWVVLVVVKKKERKTIFMTHSSSNSFSNFPKTTHIVILFIRHLIQWRDSNYKGRHSGLIKCRLWPQTHNKLYIKFNNISTFSYSTDRHGIIIEQSKIQLNSPKTWRRWYYRGPVCDLMHRLEWWT